MSSDIYFNVASWFPGNVHVKHHFNTQWGRGGHCALGCCCLVVHWCLFSFGAHMCKFLQLIVVVIPFFHFLPKWRPGNAKVRAKQHRACSSSSQGPLEIWTKRSIFLMSLWEGLKNLLNLYKIQMYYNKLYIGFFPWCTFHNMRISGVLRPFLQRSLL